MAVILAILGAAAVVSGAVIALSLLLGGRVSVGTVGAVIVALGGLLAIGYAVAAFLRTVHGWRRVLALPVLIVVGYAFYLPLGIAVYATHPPRAALGASTPADVNLPYRDVELTAPGGVTLSGWYIPSGNEAAVVLLPGSGSTRTSVLDHAVVLARHGYGVLLFDPRGHGGSGGQAMEFGWYGEQDISAAVDFLQQQPDVDPHRIGAVGLSLGGEEAIGALAADPRIRGVVAEGATNRVLADKAWLSDAHGIRGRIQLAVDSVTYGLTALLTDVTAPISLGDAVAAATPRRVLLIAGGSAPDEVPADTAIRSRSPETVELWVIPDAGHIAGLTVAPAEWEDRVTAFLAAALSPT
ncbi:alpha/beta hydrolase [Nakamurella sp. GG22]